MSQQHLDTERRRAFLDTARAIASHLEGWSLRPPKEDWGGAVLTLEGPEGKSLQLIWFSGQKSCVEGVVPDLPCGTRAHVRSEERKNLTIGVSFKRPPADLARDIERRLLPGYSEVFERIRRQVESVQAQDQEARELLDQLTAVCRCLPQTVSQRMRHQATLSDDLGSIELTRASDTRPAFIYLRLALPHAVAIDVLHLVGELQQRCGSR